MGCNKINTLICNDCYEQIEFISFPFRKSDQIKYLDEITVVVKYQDTIAKLIHTFKYRGVIGIGKTIANLIYRSANISNSNYLIPVPIHKNKKAIRGFNQTEIIATELSKLTNIPSIDLLIKIKNTASQMSIKNKEQRKSNVADSFQINPKISKIPEIVTLIDDVITTGGTLNECAKILKLHGTKKVMGLVLAQK